MQRVEVWLVKGLLREFACVSLTPKEWREVKRTNVLWAHVAAIGGVVFWCVSHVANLVDCTHMHIRDERHHCFSLGCPQGRVVVFDMPCPRVPDLAFVCAFVIIASLLAVHRDVWLCSTCPVLACPILLSSVLS
jgi:hypothetical protein